MDVKSLGPADRGQVQGPVSERPRFVSILGLPWPPKLWGLGCFSGASIHGRGVWKAREEF